MPEQSILHGIRILDFSWVLAGPYATRLLADFGAEVIKVQPPLPQATDKFSQDYYNFWNRNKLGITLNLSKSEGIEIAKNLIKISDAVVENFSPRVMINWGLDYPELVKLKPDVILLSLSAMGHTGPWQDYTGFGPTVQAFSGVTYLTTYPGRPPLGIGYSYADHVAGLNASLALLGALEHRRQTGQGQYIDLSQTETMVSLLPDAVLAYTLQGQEPTPVGNGSFQAAPYNVFPCLGKDRWCAISVYSEKEWQGFKKALGMPTWTESKRFSNIQNRLKNIKALDRLIQEWTSQHSAEEVMALLQKEGVPAGVVQSAADLANDPQLLSRGFFINLDRAPGENSVSDKSPIRFSESQAKYRRPAPAPGQDNNFVLGQILGLRPEEIDRLRQHNVI